MKPGIYTDITTDAYHKDPCPAPSLSSSVAKLLIARSPAHAHFAHPRLSAEGEVDAEGEETDVVEKAKSQKAKDRGDLVHRLVLGRGRDIEVCDFKDWRKDAAKQARADAVAAGKIATLPHLMAEAQTITKAAVRQLVDLKLDSLYRDAQSEVVIIWQEHGLWFRAMCDKLLIDETHKLAWIRDLKTVTQSSHPEACARQISNLGYDLSMAFYRRGLEAVRPDLAGRVSCAWDFVETSAPYALTPCEINGEWRMAADAKCDKAINLWRDCMEKGRWPYYTEKQVTLEPKPWDIVNAFSEPSE